MPKENDELGQKILDTAQALFNKYGVEDVSMHQVAKTAGIGQGTLYRRYPSKSKICFTLMEAKIDRLWRGWTFTFRAVRVNRWLIGCGR
ncbi:TetR/AcrR family transcriptional regulator [Paenibacillus sp. EZ-K15]|uniref:TetR/AcrR family transcriptional regulator n=1 Tax=Paenibacillus sp. EZ-K15 TaxID=2044275 RepID=UPI001F394464|nr:TetR/AcrR family transcriptional regulator [Paenibacillus sp. EZ-K15]